MTSDTFEKLKIINYLNELLNLYADFSRGRNYLWKDLLEVIFSKNFVFS